MKSVNNTNMHNNWKNRSKKYLLELECFLDKAQSIKDDALRNEIIIQMLKCDKELTNLAEKIFMEKYNSGLEEGKKKT